MSISSKIIVIVLIISSTLLYSIYERKKFDHMLEGDGAPILRTLPEFTSKDVFTKEIFTQQTIKKIAPKGSMVHIWGTWCAPCEEELPIFIKLAKKFESLDVKFILLAVQDDEKKIRKFLKRFGQLPKNILVVHDQAGKTMPKFGTVKVPETFLFAANGKNLNKFVGPQDWGHQSYFTRIKNLLGL